MKTIELLDAAKRRAGIPSDYALAARLGITRGAVSGYRCQGLVPDPLVGYKLAELLDVDPMHVIAVLESERADRRGAPEAVAAWRGILDALGIGSDDDEGPPSTGAGSKGSPKRAGVRQSIRAAMRRVSLGVAAVAMCGTAIASTGAGLRATADRAAASSVYYVKPSGSRRSRRSLGSVPAVKARTPSAVRRRTNA